jgi:signal transduction histidine kinase
MKIRAALPVLLTGLIVWIVSSVPAVSATRHVVLLFDERPELPGLAMLEAEFVRTLTSVSTDRIEVYREAMDLSRFGSDTYPAVLHDFLRTKYSDKKIDVAIGVIGPALDFLLKYGAEVFPGASIIFCGIDRKEIGDRSLPPQVRGVLVKREFAPTLDVALWLHPQTTQVIVVAGNSDFDKRLLDQARQEFSAYEDRISFTYLTTLPMAELRTNLSRLPPHTIVLFTTLFQDGASEAFIPHDAVQRVSEAANAPVYGFLDQFLGRGIVGGNLYSLAAHGTEAAKLVSQVLMGAASRTPLLEPSSNKLQFDWREMKRWSISEASLPAGSEIQFRDVDLWDQYRWQLILGLALLLIEAAIIAQLLVERHRRRIAETLSRQRTLEAVHLNRTATASALAASVGHELGQPLTAILNFAAAADINLSKQPPNIPLLKKIIDEIQQSGRRAAEIVRHTRTLLRKREEHEIEYQQFDIGDVIDSAVEFLQPEALKRGVSISVLKSGPLIVRGDHVHLEQAILNLAVNAMDAMADCPLGRRKLELRASLGNGSEVEISVNDTGTGISEKDLNNVFTTFYTTKEEGTGLGLSITRTIVENHGGKIWAENAEGGGTILKFTLPLRHTVRSHDQTVPESAEKV